MSPFPSFARTDEVASSIEAFIRERFQIARDDAGFTRQSSLWEEGYLDSIGVVELVVFIESTFGVMLPDEAFFDPAFTTIDGIARIVGGLSAQRVA
ncbi:MAG TPA: acyl carrier protein [Planctomycetota bacterium]|nr:acyl carrier protein [Planctomycetota bacterium]